MPGLSRAQLRKLSEKELREEVLVPLFEAMGFQNVEVYHWGPNEQGKDIVMSKTGELGVPEFYGVVAKQGDISGAVSGESSAGETAPQIRQCLNGEVSHPQTGESRNVRRCLVIASGRISKDTRQAIGNTIEGWQRRLTEFINGDKLWRLIEEHLGLKTIPSRLNEIGQDLEGLHPDYRVISQTSGEGIRFGIERKKGVEYPAPLESRVVIDFGTPEGREAAEKLDRHRRTGASITLSSEQIKELELPDPLKELLEPRLDEEYELAVHSRPPGREVVTRLEIESASKPSVELSPVVFRAKKVGTEEITLTNQGQHAPWTIELVIRPERGQECDFGMKVSQEGAAVTSAHKLARFIRATREGGTLRVRDIETSSELARFEVPPGQIDTSIPDEWIEFIEKAQVVEDATGVELRIPNQELTEEDVEAVYEAAHIVEQGRRELEGVESVTITMGPDGVENAVESLSDERAQLYAKSRHKVEVLDAEIDFGPREIRWSSPPLPEEERERLMTEVEEAEGDEGIPVAIPMDEASDPVIIYRDWLD